MLLKKVTIHKYKSFLTEQTYEVEKKVTRIVGKNESGKTALLEVLAKSNYFYDNSNFKYDKHLDYPRNELKRIGEEDNIKVLTCEYELTEEDIQAVENEFGQGIILNNTFSRTFYYDNKTSTTTGITYDYNVFINWLIKDVDIDEQCKNLIIHSTSFSVLEKIVSENIETQGMNEILSKLNHVKLKNNNWENVIDAYIYFTYIQPSIPKLWYFSDYFMLPYRINLNEFDEGNSSSLSKEELDIVKALFELSKLNISDIKSEENYEAFKASLESTSNVMTDEIFEYWTTNKNLEIRFEIEHMKNNIRYLNIRIYNNKLRVTLPLKNRSKGFLWFFSFLVWFSKIQGDKNCNYILLLDEPGINLHASAQNDLLRFIDEKLAPKYQVIYTTHSPFMIDSLKLNEVRTVYDTQDPKIGCIISDAIEEKDSDTLFPLQAALGYTIAQNLYVSSKNLLVEGISDLIYLNHFSYVLKSIGKEGLSDNVTIVPVGGADKVATFISLMRGNKLSCVCLLDTFIDQNAEYRLKKMIENKIIVDKKIIYYHTILKQSFADIEDLFTKEEYLQLYNGAFNASFTINDINEDKPIMNQLKKLNNHKSFNHYAPAHYMLQNISTLEFSKVTLENFEKLFNLINKII